MKLKNFIICITQIFLLKSVCFALPQELFSNPVVQARYSKEISILQALWQDTASMMFLAQNTELSKGPLRWKMGEALNYQVKIKGISLAAISWKLESETQTDLILTQSIHFLGKVIPGKAHYNKKTGKLSRYALAGAIWPITDQNNIRYQSEPRLLSVDAGTFNTLYFQDQNENKIERQIWMSLSDLPLTGIVQTKFNYKSFELSFELESFANIK